MHLTKIEKGSLKEEVLVPGSKSYANRALILASLNSEEFTLSNLNLCDDVLFLMKALEKVGIKIEERGNDYVVMNSFPACESEGNTLFVGDGGTTFRFLLPFLSLGHCEYQVQMGEQLASRPHEELVSKLQELHVKIKRSGNSIILQGPLKHKRIEVDSKLSSQFASALKLSGVDVVVKNLENSRSYFAMTEELVKNLKNISSYTVPGDFSSAAFPIAFAFVNKGQVKLKNIFPDPFQADEKILTIIKSHGARVERLDEGIMIDCKKRDSKGLHIDLSDCLDLAPALSYMASFQEEESLFLGVHGLVVKESNRLLEIQKLLQHFSIQTIHNEKEDKLRILPQKILNYQSDIITAHDHRMVMTTILFLKSLEGGKVNHISAIQKSFPHFLDIFDDKAL